MEDLLNLIGLDASPKQIFRQVEVATRRLGFDHCAYGLRMTLPLTKPRTIILNNYPLAWQRRYAEAGYLAIDPTVRHAQGSQRPLVWEGKIFATTPALWDEVQAHGLSVGWAQSSIDPLGGAGMLTLVRCGQVLTSKELAVQEFKLRWLVSVTHQALSRAYGAEAGREFRDSLTHREIEILKWTGDGKSAQDIADILLISKNTVDFHLKNAIIKLHAANKTAAVVRAAMLGLLT
jgi:DNA-binding CsgD family transcriptional regulator